MKITLEINTSNIQDIVEAIETLKPLLPKEMDVVYKEDCDAKENPDNIDNKTNLHNENEDLVSKSEIENLKKELEKAETLIAELRHERDLLSNEVDEAFKKINTLELKESIDFIDFPEIPDESNVENKYDEEYINNIKKDYDSKIEDLNKKIEFHENRSNKNFEEVKRLRALVDSISLEKRNLEKKVNVLEKENEDLKELSTSDNSEELNSIKSENKDLLDKMKSLESLKEKLEKDVEFQKNRSKTNWDELKALKAEHDNLLKENDSNKKTIDELKQKVEASGSEGAIEKLKLDFVQAKSDYENTISELRLSNDKLQNELNLYIDKFSDEDIEELNSLKRIKTAICSSEKGAAFWNGVESKIDKIQ